MSTEGVGRSTPAEETQETSQAGAAQGKPKGNAPAMTGSFNSLEQLKSENPELWNTMMTAMATEITNKLKKSQERIKKINREGQQG